MKLFRFRTKLEAACAIFIVAILLTTVVFSVRIITDSNDNIALSITNSNGGVWPATSVNIQTAIWDLNDTEGTVWIPQATINFASPLQGQSGVNLIGIGNGSILRLADGNINDDIFRIAGKKNILINNIQFDGNNQNNNGGGPSTICAIDITGFSENITIKDCYIHNTCWNSIRIGPNSSNIVVSFCFFNNCTNTHYPSAVLIQGDRCTVKNCIIRDTYAVGVIIESSATNPSSYNIIDSNIITGNVACGVLMENPKSNKSTIVNNIICDINSTAFEVSEGWFSKGIILQTDSICSNNQIINTWNGGIDSSGNNLISNNVIDDVGNATGYGIIHGADGYCEIIGNKISNTGHRAINGGSGYELVSSNYIYNSGGTAIHLCDVVTSNIIDGAPTGINRGIVISMNNITGVTIGIVASNYSSIVGNYIVSVDRGIDTDTKENCTISNNVISASGGGSAGIIIDSSNNCTLSANRIPTASKGIYEAGTSDWNIIGLNNCMGCTTPIDINGANTVNTTNLGAIS